MKILSFDCADRTFGVSLMDINFDLINSTFKKIEVGELTQENINETSLILRQTIQLLFCESVDLLGKNICETTRYYRTNALKTYLDKIKDHDIDLILIENQNINHVSQVVQDKIEMYFEIIHPNVKRVVISPREKNKIYIEKVGGRETFLSKYSRPHNANKAHATANFIHLSKFFSWELPKIPKSKLNHIADACMQTIAYIKPFCVNSNITIISN
ncbi:MAG: hypothetical protein KAS12_01470 [Candidatus Aenigmarchaeota archaeon]|nr:hypothetical protein [Candidatus Aenigmarchaeota archaeon]